jgi:hypothetical protein
MRKEIFWKINTILEYENPFGNWYGLLKFSSGEEKTWKSNF